MAISVASGKLFTDQQNLNTASLTVEHTPEGGTPHTVVDTGDSMATEKDEVNIGIQYSIISKGLHLATAMTLQEEEKDRAKTIDSSIKLMLVPPLLVQSDSRFELDSIATTPAEI